MTIKNAHFVDKYYWIMDHPLNRVSEINFFQNEIDIQPQLVNPMTNEIDMDDSRNTTERWRMDSNESICTALYSIYAKDCCLLKIGVPVT